LIPVSHSPSSQNTLTARSPRMKENKSTTQTLFFYGEADVCAVAMAT